jgi:hypothetical protein
VTPDAARGGKFIQQFQWLKLTVLTAIRLSCNPLIQIVFRISHRPGRQLACGVLREKPSCGEKSWGRLRVARRGLLSS